MRKLKLNRKGFTLIELLAIIVILAIIMVVTIPTILNLTGDTTKTQFETSANAIETWVTSQYDYDVSGLGTPNSAYTAVCGDNGVNCFDGDLNTPGAQAITLNPTADDTDAKEKSINFIEAAGQESSNYSQVTVQIKDNGRVCVKATASQADGASFKGVTEEVSSNGC